MAVPHKECSAQIDALFNIFTSLNAWNLNFIAAMQRLLERSIWYPLYIYLNIQYLPLLSHSLPVASRDSHWEIRAGSCKHCWCKLSGAPLLPGVTPAGKQGHTPSAESRGTGVHKLCTHCFFQMKNKAQIKPFKEGMINMICAIQFIRDQGYFLVYSFSNIRLTFFHMAHLLCQN